MARPADKFHGILLLDKPSGITSHDAVDRIRRITHQRSVGHVGTLDSAAEGLLLLCLGKATKIARFLSGLDKTYEAQITLGLESKTYDAEGLDPAAIGKPIPQLDEKAISELLAKFTGSVLQTVPAYSAVHVDGKRLYELARAGQAVELPQREVKIYKLELLSFESDKLQLRVSCSKGTYIRSLAHDIGRQIGCGGYLSYLRRTAIGPHTSDLALTFEAIDELSRNDNLEERLLRIEQVLDFGKVTITDDGSRFVKNGRQPRPEDILKIEGSFQPGDRILLRDAQGLVLAIGMATISSTDYQGTGSDAIIQFDRVLA